MIPEECLMVEPEKIANILFLVAGLYCSKSTLGQAKLSGTR